MAVIGQIRKHSGLIVTLIGIAILGFVVQDGLGNRQGKAPAVAEVGGEKVFYQAFDDQVKQIEDQYKRAQGEDVNITPEDMTQIRTMAWEKLVSQILMDKACSRIGIQVSQEEMNDMYYGKFISPLLYNYFVNPTTGQYDRNQVMMIINNFDQMSDQDKKTLTELERTVKEERAKEKYYYMVAKAFYTPKAFAAELAHQQSDMADARYAFLPYSSIDDANVKITDAHYKSFYEKNKYLFQIEKAARDIEFVVWDVVPTGEDMIAIQKNVEEIYADLQTEENIPDFVMTVSSSRFDSIYKSRAEIEPTWDSLLFNASIGTYFSPRIVGNSFQMAKLMDVQMRPDSLRCSYLLVGYSAQAGQQGQPQRTQEQAKAFADSLKNVATTQTIEQFALLAAQHSDDPAAKQNGGDMGWQKDANLMNFPAAAREAMLHDNVGSLKVVELPNAYMLMRVTGRTAPIKKVLYCLVNIPIEPSTSTSKTEFAKASRLLAQCKNSKSSFADICSKNKVSLRSATRVDELADQIQGLTHARDIVRWAFKKETKVGHVSQEVFEMDNRYVVASLKFIHKKGYMSLEEVKAIPQVEYRVMREAKADMLVEKAQKAKGSSSVEQAAQKMGSDAQVGEAAGVAFGGYVFGSCGYEPALIGTVFGMKANTFSAPVKGNSGVYILLLNQIQRGEVSGTIDMIRSQMGMMFQQKTVQMVRGALEEDFSLVDNRAFYF